MVFGYPQSKRCLSGRNNSRKVSSYAKELNKENFKASDGWLHRWKERKNITFKNIFGESNPVTTEMVHACKETSLPTLLSNYDLKNIYITLTSLDYSTNI